MKILLVSCILLATTEADIGLKLRQQQQLLQNQQQQLLQNQGINNGADGRNNPFFIPNNGGGNFGGAGAAATNVEQRAAGNGKTERTHTLEELCNDAFHSFLCKPVNGEKRRRIDGNLRPGAVLPPGLRPESSNTRENKLLPPNNPKPNNNKQFDNQVPAAQSEQGYFYPKPSNTLEVNKPLKNGYLPPDNGFKFTQPPRIQTTRPAVITTPRPLLPQTSRFTPFTFPPTTQRQFTQPPTTRRPFTQPPTTRRPFTQPPITRQSVPSSFDVRFQTTQRPFTTTRAPTTLFTPSRPIFTQPVKYETRQTVFNTYLPPVSTTRSPPTTRAPFFTRPPPSPTVYTTRLPPQTRPPPPPPPTLPPLKFTTTYRPPTRPPITFQPTTPRYQTVPNTYLPPFAEQKLNPVYISTTTTPKPTLKPVSFNPFPTTNTFTAPANTYLPPDNGVLDIRFGSASNTRPGSALVPDAAQNPSVTAQPDEEDNLERLCNDPFHSFLCQPITKTRYKFDGRLRPQAVIPQGVLISSNTFNTPVKTLPEQPESSNVQSTSIPVNSGYDYQKPASNLQQNAQAILGYVIPAANQQSFLISSNENSVSSSGYFYPAPSDTGLTSAASANTQQGYEYQRPLNNPQFNYISTTAAPELSSLSQQYSTFSTTPKPLFQNNQFLQNNLLAFQNTNNQPFLVTSTEKSQSLDSGYNYPKPSFNQQFTFPSSTSSPVTFDYTPKTDTQFTYITSTPRPNSLFETSTPIGSTFQYQPTGSQATFFTGFKSSNPTNGPGITISTTEKPSTLVYEYQNQIFNQVSPSIPPQTVFNYQKTSNPFVTSSVVTQEDNSNGYNYPKPQQPLQEEATINTESGYLYPKPSIPFQDNRLNSFGNTQFFKNAQNPFSFSKGNSYSLNQPSSLNSFGARQQTLGQGFDPKTAKNINQLLGPSSESNNRDLPPASQFEILKVKKRHNS